jgi:DNA primase
MSKIRISHPLFEFYGEKGNYFKKISYFRHKVGVNSTSMVKISNRPSSMAAEHTQVWKSLNTP